MEDLPAREPDKAAGQAQEYGASQHLSVPRQIRARQGVSAYVRAQLIKYLDDKMELKEGSREVRIAARDWISMFPNDTVVREV